MYSCANYPRGCRGRVNIPGGKCSDCVTLNLRRPSSLSSSPFAQNREYRRPIRTEHPQDKTNEV
ncbi:hypothetical protein VTN77DRAFT_2981 [Rasamsonia byssochlamydoides]|uniref:uncharacterized protein n=1 Tax=Rasamsonia byssochlamydoides TaxID=89139 RepID=UPI00374244B1